MTPNEFLKYLKEYIRKNSKKIADHMIEFKYIDFIAETFEEHGIYLVNPYNQMQRALLLSLENNKLFEAVLFQLLFEDEKAEYLFHSITVGLEERFNMNIEDIEKEYKTPFKIFKVDNEYFIIENDEPLTIYKVKFIDIPIVIREMKKLSKRRIK